MFHVKNYVAFVYSELLTLYLYFIYFINRQGSSKSQRGPGEAKAGAS